MRKATFTVRPAIKAVVVFPGESSGCQCRPPSDRHHVSLLPAPPKCLFKPTHCSANWITFHVKIDLLKQQRRWQIKTAALQKYTAWWAGEEELKARTWEEGIFWCPAASLLSAFLPFPLYSMTSLVCEKKGGGGF